MGRLLLQTSTNFHFGDRATDYVATLAEEAAELGVYLPLPDPEVESLLYLPPAHYAPVQACPCLYLPDV